MFARLAGALTPTVMPYVLLGLVLSGGGVYWKGRSDGRGAAELECTSARTGALASALQGALELGRDIAAGVQTIAQRAGALTAAATEDDTTTTRTVVKYVRENPRPVACVLDSRVQVELNERVGRANRRARGEPAAGAGDAAGARAPDD